MSVSFFLLKWVLDVLNIFIVDIHNSFELRRGGLIDDIIICLTDILVHGLEGITIICKFLYLIFQRFPEPLGLALNFIVIKLLKLIQHTMQLRKHLLNPFDLTLQYPINLP